MNKFEMKTRIHVNQHNIKANAKDGGNRSVLTAKDYRQNRKGQRVAILVAVRCLELLLMYPRTAKRLAGRG